MDVQIPKFAQFLRFYKGNYYFEGQKVELKLLHLVLNLVTYFASILRAHFKCKFLQKVPGFGVELETDHLHEDPHEWRFES